MKISENQFICIGTETCISYNLVTRESLCIAATKQVNEIAQKHVRSTDVPFEYINFIRRLLVEGE